MKSPKTTNSLIPNQAQMNVIIVLQVKDGVDRKIFTNVEYQDRNGIELEIRNRLGLGARLSKSEEAQWTAAFKGSIRKLAYKDMLELDANDDIRLSSTGFQVIKQNPSNAALQAALRSGQLAMVAQGASSPSLVPAIFKKLSRDLSWPATTKRSLVPSLQEALPAVLKATEEVGPDARSQQIYIRAAELLALDLRRIKNPNHKDFKILQTRLSIAQTTLWKSGLVARSNNSKRKFESSITALGLAELAKCGACPDYASLQAQAGAAKQPQAAPMKAAAQAQHTIPMATPRAQTLKMSFFDTKPTRQPIPTALGSKLKIATSGSSIAATPLQVATANANAFLDSEKCPKEGRRTIPLANQDGVIIVGKRGEAFREEIMAACTGQDMTISFANAAAAHFRDKSHSIVFSTKVIRPRERTILEAAAKNASGTVKIL